LGVYGYSSVKLAKLNPDYALDFVVRALNGCNIGTRTGFCNGNIEIEQAPKL